jgi:GMP synthase (glutamine-hydrolysing)
VIATSTGAPFAAVANDARKIYGVQFHPEVVHTVNGSRIYRNFLFNIAGLTGDWTMASFRQEMVQKIRTQVGDGKVICGLSGGVDSSVAAVLIHEAIGAQLTCVFVDTGLLRKNEADQVVTLFRDHYNIPLIHVDAGDMFLGELAGDLGSRDQAQDRSVACSSKSSTRKPARSTARRSWPRARSIPTSSRASRPAAARRR